MGHDCEWDSTNVADLAKLFSDTLHTRVHNAITKICENGYTKEIAEDTVLKCGPFYGIKDLVSSIVDRALDCLKVKRSHGWYTFDDVNSLVEYMMLEMVSMLTYVKPSLSVHEAMWTLFIYDFNVLVASDPDKFYVYPVKEEEGTTSSSKTEAQTDQIPSQVQETEAQKASKSPSRSRNEENCHCCKKLCSGYKRVTIRQKPFKGQMSRKALKARMATLESLCPPLKETEKVPPEPCQSKTADYYLAGIPYDESKGERIPHDDQDRMILAAVGQLESLQKEVKSWDDWASVKVMQVAKRLSQDQAEIKKLKAEKFTEESTKKKLSETTSAITTTDCQIQMSCSTIARLESDQSILKVEKERAENRSLIAAKSLEEALCREVEALNKSGLCGSEKKLLEEDLKTLKREAGSKQRDLDKAKQVLKETQTRLAQEKREAAKFHEQAESIRNERQRLQALAEAGYDIAAKRAGKQLKKLETEIKRIEYEIAALNLEAETKRKAAISWQLSEGTSRSEGSRNSYRHRECVMCLTEEMSVLFVPCGHQVLCSECNVIHEDNGMKECPSCRAPIQQRINCVFAKSSA